MVLKTATCTVGVDELQDALACSVGVRFQRARFPVKIDPIVQPGALGTRLYRAGSDEVTAADTQYPG